MMGLSIVVLFLLPWLDRCRCVRYAIAAPCKLNIAQFVVCFYRTLGCWGVAIDPSADL